MVGCVGGVVGVEIGVWYVGCGCVVVVDGYV